ncbi:hypothetical protein Bca52824_038865 [Brassica carinata]|uniref:Uncharacterized protein n=1 Tax=Brassica carinata TaxID=52824 RepID=A0A8X7RPX1_BRACI|nr:hypothetical protein Bca52824_038865 [Brassica carinata]
MTNSKSSKEKHATSAWKFRLAADTNDAGNRDVIPSICADSIADYVMTGYMIFAKDDDFHNLAQTIEDFARSFNEMRFLATMAIENQEKTIRVIQPKKTVNMISLRNLSWQGLRARTIKENYDKISEKRKLTPVEARDQETKKNKIVHDRGTVAH